MRDILKLCGRREWVSRKNMSAELWGEKYPSLTGDMAHAGVMETWDLQKEGNKYFCGRDKSYTSGSTKEKYKYKSCWKLWC